MSHIPAAAMKHAGPHLDAPDSGAHPARPDRGQGTGKGLGTGGWSLVALGGILAIAGIAAAAGPLSRRLRGAGGKPKPKPKRKRPAGTSKTARG